jgi:hypothetical protein
MVSVGYEARKALMLVLALGISGLTIAAGTSGEQGTEKKISRAEVPAPVMSAFQSMYPKAKITGTAQETEDSTTYFEIESKDGKVKRDLLYKVDGTVKEIEESVSKANLPAPIKDAVAKEYPKGKIKQCEKTTRDGVIAFELIVKNGKDKLEVVLDDSGKILKADKMVDEEKDED